MSEPISPMRILLHDTLVTAPIVHPFTSGWVEGTAIIEAREALSATDIGPDDAALIPAAEIAALAETHAVVASVAVVLDGLGPIAMRVPVRPDEIDRSAVRLYHASATAEVLARATLEPFYGISPSEWVTEHTEHAQIVIVEGAMALQAPEAGFSEDLVRAWFILTGLPLVSHVAIVPRSGDVTAAVTALETARQLGYERRKDVRVATAERLGVERETQVSLATTTRYGLNDGDRRALMQLLQRGNKGSRFPYVWELAYAGEAAPNPPDALA